MKAKMDWKQYSEYQPEKQAEAIVTEIDYDTVTTLEEQFLKGVYFSPCGCWWWRRGRWAERYGRFRSRAAHIWSYEHFCGPIPLGREIHHSCRNSRCVNPDHLVAVTPAQHRSLHRSYDERDSSNYKLDQFHAPMNELAERWWRQRRPFFVPDRKRTA